MFRILPVTDVYAREIFDSHGNFAIEVKIAAGEKCLGKAQVPSGKIGKRDIKKTVLYINEKLSRELIDVNVLEQSEIDSIIYKLCEENSGEKNATNVMQALSVAAARCAATEMGIPLYRYLGGVVGKKMPIPMVYIASCGEKRYQNAPVREFLMIPVKVKKFSEAIQMCVNVYQKAQTYVEGESSKLDRHGGLIFEGKEEDVLECLKTAAKEAGFESGKDFYFVTNCSAMENAVWIRSNRIGTVSRVVETMRGLQKEGKVVILAQDSEETEDTFGADLSVAMGCRLIKLGAPGRMENTAKYNRLLEIEEALGENVELSAFQEH